MNKKDIVMRVLDPQNPSEYIPAGFFLHFDPAYHRGAAAVDKHLEFFRFTEMDFVKIQYERTFPLLDNIKNPSDWENMPLYDLDFYAPQLEVVQGLVKSSGHEVLVLPTLYSPFMYAGHAVGTKLLDQHLIENPEAVKKGLQIITESLLGFVRECIRLGVDGFYASTQGGETFRFEDCTIFSKYIQPYDLLIMEEINQACQFNVLHICDYHGEYDDLSPYTSFPGHVVNSSLHVGTGTTSPREIAQLFQRPFMGGLDRKGILTYGSPKQIEKEVLEVLAKAPERFILAADCTVPSGTPWENLRLAIRTAHHWRR